MSTTLVVGRQRLSEAINDYWASSTTSAGGASGATLVDSTLLGLADDNDSFPNYYVLLPAGPDGASAKEVRRVKLTSGYTASSGTVTPSRAFSAQVASSVSYELHRYHPVDLKERALQRAAELLFPDLYLAVRDQSLVVDNLLSNSDFEETISGGAHPSWTNVNSPTVTTETTIIQHGAQAAKVVAGGSVGRLYQAVTPQWENVAGKTAKLKMWVFATAASTARIALSFDGGTTFTYSDYHAGQTEWELLSASLEIPTTATSIRAYLEVAASGTGYFDAGWLAIHKVNRYTVPSTIKNGPFSVKTQYVENEPNGLYIEFNENLRVEPIEGRRLQLEGMGILTRPTTESGTFEVSDHLVDLLVARAAQWLFAALASNPGDVLQDGYVKQETRWAQTTQELLAKPGYRMYPPKLQEAQGWGTDDSGETRYLILRQHRDVGPWPWGSNPLRD